MIYSNHGKTWATIDSQSSLDRAGEALAAVLIFVLPWLVVLGGTILGHLLE